MKAHFKPFWMMVGIISPIYVSLEQYFTAYICNILHKLGFTWAFRHHYFLFRYLKNILGGFFFAGMTRKNAFFKIIHASGSIQISHLSVFVCIFLPFSCTF